MGENNLILWKKNELITGDVQKIRETGVTVEYGAIDSSRYSFKFNVDNDVSVDMIESDRSFDSSSFVDAEIIGDIPRGDRYYYIAAAVSGLVTGLFSELDFNWFSKSQIVDEKYLSRLVVTAARIAGYKNKDFKGAAKYLFNRFVLSEQVLDAEKKIKKKMDSNPTLAGLIFSIASQFSGKRYLVDDDGTFIFTELPQYYIIGDNNAEKIIFGALYWVFELGKEYTNAKYNILRNLRLPHVIIRILTDFFNLKLFKDENEDALNIDEKAFSKWLKKTFKDDSGEAGIVEGFLGDLKILSEKLIEDSIPVLINECVVRIAYIVRTLYLEADNRGICSLKELFSMDVKSAIPYDNRVFSRMQLISSACFEVIDIGGAVIRIVKGKKARGFEFAEDYIAEINVVGIGRFIFALKNDIKYWKKDINIILDKFRNWFKGMKKEEKQSTEDNNNYENIINMVALNPAQCRLMLSIENLMVKSDISRTVKNEDKKLKEEWLDDWKEKYIRNLKIDAGNIFFEEDENHIYELLYEAAKDKVNHAWIYLMTMELAEFRPYSDGEKYKKLKVQYDYFAEIYMTRQTLISANEANNIKKLYSYYESKMNGSRQRKFWGIGIASVVTIASGGLALAFAPQIAVALAGEAVAGLHGVALTSASLAAVGGGSLAAGGLGMAGGTAIITGGGALIGLAGSGSAAMAAVLKKSDSEYWVKQCTKLLTFSSCYLADRNKEFDMVMLLRKCIYKIKEGTLEQLECLKLEDNDLDKKDIDNIEDSLKVFERALDEFGKIMRT